MAASESAETLLWGWQSQIKTIAERGRQILGTDFLSDVTFRVGPKDGETVDIKAHKFVLALGSMVFETMFYGSLPETKSIIPITDIDPESFKVLLRYLYHDQIGPFDDTTAFPTLNAAKKYGLPILKDVCEGYLRENVTAQNCIAWFVQAKMYVEPELAELFLSTIDAHGPLVLESADFLEVDVGTLKEILSRDSLKVREVDVYHAAVKWARHCCAREQIDDTGVNLRAALGDALFLIRFPIMTSQEVASGPAKLGILFAEEVNQVFQYWFANETLPGHFISKRRHLSADLHIARFGRRQDGWTYADGWDVNGIKLSITSVTDKTNRNVDLSSISLAAVGLYLSSDQQPSSSQRPAYRQCQRHRRAHRPCCSCGHLYSAHHGQYCPSRKNDNRCAVSQPSSMSAVQPGPANPSFTITLKVYIELGVGGWQDQLAEFHHTFHPPAWQTEDRVYKIILSKAVPLKIHERYTVTADITGIQKSYYGTEGKSSVTKATSSGDLNVTVQFASDSEGGKTTVTQGQLPEFFFEVIG